MGNELKKGNAEAARKENAKPWGSSPKHGLSALVEGPCTVSGSAVQAGLWGSSLGGVR